MFRTLAPRSSQILQARIAQSARFLSLTSAPRANHPKDKKHAVDKVYEGDTSNIQESSVKAGMDAHKSGTGGNATERKDCADGTAKAKKEFPEAPDTIGMQDERGGRGG